MKQWMKLKVKKEGKVGVKVANTACSTSFANQGSSCDRCAVGVVDNACVGLCRNP